MTVKIKKEINNNVRISVRITVDKKKVYKKKAKDLGLNLTELVINLLEGLQPPDREAQNSLYAYLTKITKEMNHIGNNINQVTTAIHQIKNHGIIEMGEFNTFNKLLSEYNSKRENLREAINKIMFL